MKRNSRETLASTFSVMKGALINETYAVFEAWDFDRSKKENLDRLREENYIGAKTVMWLRNIAKALNQRFDPAGRDRPLVMLAKHGLPIDEWKPLLFWHITRDEFLVRDFMETWLFEAYNDGVFRIRASDVATYLTSIDHRKGIQKSTWSEQTTKRIATGLLKMAADFGFLRGSVVKEFTSFHLPEKSFLYLLHAMRDEKLSPSKLVASPKWRLFLLRPSDVEHELLRLHQYRKLEYQVAGSLVELSLPCTSTSEYAERMVV